MAPPSGHNWQSAGPKAAQPSALAQKPLRTRSPLEASKEENKGHTLSPVGPRTAVELFAKSHITSAWLQTRACADLALVLSLFSKEHCRIAVKYTNSQDKTKCRVSLLSLPPLSSEAEMRSLWRDFLSEPKMKKARRKERKEEREGREKERKGRETQRERERRREGEREERERM